MKTKVDTHFNPKICTDNLKAYHVLPTDKYLIGKSFTQRIDRENCTLRNRIK
ncbi:hypothetical protein J8V46_07030 [Xenorhabdus sp. PB30.3]|nr:hypothetical protein [Xenorhabdus sp. PB30.3]